MIVLIIFSIIMMTGGFYVIFGDDLDRSLKAHKKNKVLAIEPKDNLSIVAKKVLALYNKLPVEHQFGDIKAMLHAMDVKCDIVGKQKVQHFNSWSERYRNEYFDFSWNGAYDTRCFGQHDDCEFAGYVILKKKIETLLAELEERERLLKIADVQGDLDALSSFLQHLDTERSALVESNQTIQNVLNPGGNNVA